MTEREPPLLEVRSLTKEYPLIGAFRKRMGTIRALDDFSLAVRQGETVGLVGESGSGKSTAGRVIARLVEATSGSIVFQNRDITNATGAKLRGWRRDLQMIFQDPDTSLNPKLRVGDIVSEPVRNYTRLSGRQAQTLAAELLLRVGLSADACAKYPHEFSGGQKQRIGIARALALNPKLIVADEPVSALDMSVQAQVLNLMRDLQQESGLSYLFISHDLSIVHAISDRIGVMYAGRLIEWADKRSLYRTPLHPYTQQLIAAIPVPDPRLRANRIVPQDEPPGPAPRMSGCAFRARCGFAKPACAEIVPSLKPAAADHQVACHLYD
ncbi:ABC transporter ATP-binding protein [Cohnella sp. 56]